MGMGIKHRIGNGNGREWETNNRSGNGNYLNAEGYTVADLLDP